VKESRKEELGRRKLSQTKQKKLEKIASSSSLLSYFKYIEEAFRDRRIQGDRTAQLRRRHTKGEVRRKN